jgi:hypothetical protein
MSDRFSFTCDLKYIYLTFYTPHNDALFKTVVLESKTLEKVEGAEFLYYCSGKNGMDASLSLKGKWDILIEFAHLSKIASFSPISQRWTCDVLFGSRNFLDNLQKRRDWKLRLCGLVRNVLSHTEARYFLHEPWLSPVDIPFHQRFRWHPKSEIK